MGSEMCIRDSCEACYDFLVEEKGIPEEQIVLYGQSLGTGPTSELASRKPRVGGVVLHSPLASGVRVLSPNLRWWPIWCDIFPNFKLVEKIQAPTLIETPLQMAQQSLGAQFTWLMKAWTAALYSRRDN